MPRLRTTSGLACRAMPNAPCILYDLRYAADHFPGIGTHAFALLEALLEQPGDERFRVLWNPAEPCRRFDTARLGAHRRVQWVECDAPSLGPATARKTGAWARRTGGDVLFSPFSLMPERPGMPVVLTLHDVLPLSPESRTPWWRRAVFAFAMRAAAQADVVLTSSEFSRGEIARRTRIPRERVRVVRLGVLPEAQASRRPAALPEGAFALTVGINKPHKNLTVLAEAWRGFGAEPPLRLVAVGPTDERFPAWPELARGVSGVHALGPVPQPELEWLYHHATVVLHPSRYEGFGLPVLEAAARGAPIVAADVPALRELADGVAEFVPPDDPAAWGQAVRRLAADLERRQRMAASGRTLAAAHGYARVAAEVLVVLRELARR